MQVIDAMHNAGVWEAWSNDAVNLRYSPIHLTGERSLAFDKADGTADTVYAGVRRALSVRAPYDPHDYLYWPMHFAAKTNVVRAILRLEEDSANYLEWRFEAADIKAAQWTLCRARIGEAFVGGAGCCLGLVRGVSVAVQFSAEANALADMLLDSAYLVAASEV